MDREEIENKVIKKLRQMLDNNIFGYLQINIQDGKIRTIAEHQTEKITEQ